MVSTPATRSFCFTLCRDHTRLSTHGRFSPSLLRFEQLLRPRLTSVRPSRHLATPVAHGRLNRSPRVIRATFLLMPVGSTSQRSVQVSGFDDCGRLTPLCRLIRFLFVRPAFCLGLPSDSQSPATPLPLANTSPCRVCRGLSPPSRLAHHHSELNSASHGATRHAWRTTKKAARQGSSLEINDACQPARRPTGSKSRPLDIATSRKRLAFTERLARTARASAWKRAAIIGFGSCFGFCIDTSRVSGFRWIVLLLNRDDKPVRRIEGEPQALIDRDSTCCRLLDLDLRTTDHKGVVLDCGQRQRSHGSS